MVDSLRFNCGEYKPGKRPIDIPPIKRPNPNWIPDVVQPTPKRRPKKEPPVPPPPPPPPVIPPVIVPPVGVPDLYMCIDNGTIGIEGCPNPENKHIVLVTPGVKRKCRKCTNAEITADIARHNKNPAIPRKCVSKQKCEQNCKDSPPVCREQGPITQPPGSIPPQTTGNPEIIGPQPLPGGGSVIDTTPIFTPPPSEGGGTNTPTDIGGIRETKGILFREENDEITFVGIRAGGSPNPEEILTLPEEGNLQMGQTSEGIFHPLFTLFSQSPSNSTSLVSNGEYLNIFDTQVSKEVGYILNAGNRDDWTEVPYNLLSLNNLAFSLNADLLEAILKIHANDNTIIPIRIFLETIKKLLVTDRLDEFDSDYFIFLSNQQQDDRILYLNKSNTSRDGQLGLGLLAESAIPADFNRAKQQSREKLKRYRPLLTDIELNIPVDSICDGEPVPCKLSATNLGYPVQTLCKGDSNLSIGDGAGYYVSSISLNCKDDLPLEGENQLSASYYIQDGVRDLSLDLLGGNSIVELTVSSTETGSEFLAQEQTTDDGPLPPGQDVSGLIGYFRLEISSIENVDNSDPFIERLRARYVLMTDPDEIRNHALNYGYGVTRLNVDYRDLFHEYAMKLGIIDLQQDEIGYQSLYTRRAANHHVSILVRSLPAGIVLVPGKGSKHNPFAGGSTLMTTRETPVRTLRVRDDFQIEGSDKLALDTSFIGDSGQYYVGLSEKFNQDTQTTVFYFDPDSEIYQGTYVTNGEVHSIPTSLESRPTTKLVYEVIDTALQTRYNIDGLTWWDIFSRLAARTYFALDYEVPASFYGAITNGWRGPLVREVMNRTDVGNETGIISVKNSFVEDRVYLTEEGRKNAKNY